MTNEEAIEELRGYKQYCRTMGFRFNDCREALDMAIESLKQTQWIPCEERLPEDGNTTYMVTVDYGEFGGGTGQRFYYGKDIGWDDDAVVAWMPLPKPYGGRTE